jgi:hypothetical protein
MKDSKITIHTNCTKVFCDQKYTGGSGGSVLYSNPSYWEARTWDGLKSLGPQHHGSQRIPIRILGLERLAK